MGDRFLKALTSGDRGCFLGQKFWMTIGNWNACLFCDKI